SFMATDPVTSAICTSFYQPTTQSHHHSSPASFSTSPLVHHNTHNHHHHHHHLSTTTTSSSFENGTHLTLNALPLNPDREPDESSDRVSGWIEEERVHPDYVLQGLKPYATLEDDVRRAMRAEPTPPTAVDGEEVLVATTLVANADTGLITRYTLCRTTASPSLALAGEAETAEVTERWEEVPVMDLDDVLASAVEGLVQERRMGCKEVEDVVLGS